jgi:tetratricopeptide (TPR) repeat protein
MSNENEQLWEVGALSFPVCSAEDLPLAQLRLGSYLYDGELPAYVNRDIDSTISRLVRDVDVSLVLISGPPKSGKTRSLVNAITSSPGHGKAIYWLNSHPASVHEFLERFDEFGSEDRLIVLDDLQRFGLGTPGKFSLRQLGDLRSRGKVIGTVHDEALANWRLDGVDHRSTMSTSPGYSVSREIEKACVHIDSRLSDSELKGALERLGLDPFEHLGIECLAAYMAAGDLHFAQFDKLSKGSAFEIAVFDSLLTSQIMAPQGVTLHQLKTLTKYYLVSKSPNSPWLDRKWDDLIDSITQGASPGSFHAMMMRSWDDVNRFHLMDFVWSKFLNFEFENIVYLLDLDIPGPNLIGLDPLTAAYSAFENDFNKFAARFLEPLIDVTSPISKEETFDDANGGIPYHALELWAELCLEDRDYQQAIACFQDLVLFYEELDSDEAQDLMLGALVNLGVCFQEVENYEKARECFSLTIQWNPNFDRGYFYLALLEERESGPAQPGSIQFNSRSELLRKAVQLSPENGDYTYKLGMLLEKTDSKEAIDLLLRSVESGDLNRYGLEFSYQTLGNLHGSEGNWVGAIDFYNLGKALSEDDWPFFLLGIANLRLGNLETARELFQEFNALSGNTTWEHPDAWMHLAEAERGLGNEHEALRCAAHAERLVHQEVRRRIEFSSNKAESLESINRDYPELPDAVENFKRLYPGEL